MNDYMTKPLADLAKDIIADGVVDEEEVKKLRERIFADGIVDRDEADFLFDINDAVTGNKNHPSWQKFFIEAISSYLLDDEVSPGEIDDDEAEWLLSRIMGDSQIDETERALVREIQTKATTVSEKLKKIM